MVNHQLATLSGHFMRTRVSLATEPRDAPELPIKVQYEFRVIGGNLVVPIRSGLHLIHRSS